MVARPLNICKKDFPLSLHSFLFPRLPCPLACTITGKQKDPRELCAVTADIVATALLSA